MSGEINYRKYTGTPSPKSKYLSDSLTPWYGRWSDGIGYPGNVEISYTGLPIGDTVARITRSMPVGGTNIFEFNESQNVSGYQLEFWIKAENVDAQLYIEFSPNTALTFASTIYCYKLLYAGGTSPIVWTKVSLTLDSSLFAFVGLGPHSLPFVRCRSISLYRDAPAAARIIDVSGFTIRRL